MSGFEQFIQERIYLQNVSPRTVDWYRQTFQMAGKISPHHRGSEAAPWLKEKVSSVYQEHEVLVALDDNCREENNLKGNDVCF